MSAEIPDMNFKLVSKTVPVRFLLGVQPGTCGWIHRIPHMLRLNVTRTSETNLFWLDSDTKVHPVYSQFAAFVWAAKTGLSIFIPDMEHVTLLFSMPDVLPQQAVILANSSHIALDKRSLPGYH